VSFRSGSISCVRCAVASGAAPQSVDDALFEALQANRIRPESAGQGTDTASGWIAGRHLLDLWFGYEANAFGGCMLASMRTDTAKVPAGLLRAYRALALDEAAGIGARSRATAGSGGAGAGEPRRVTRADRLDAKDRADRRGQEELSQGLWRRVAERPVLWDLALGTIWSPVGSDAAFEQLNTLIDSTFECRIERQTAGRLAASILGARGRSRDFDDLLPSAFVPPPQAVATDEEGAPRTMGANPDVPWSTIHPADWLGNEFLLWLWWATERQEGAVDTEDGEVAFVLERSLDLSCAWGVSGESAVRGDAPTRTPEAARALLSGKWPRKVGMTLSAQGRAYRFTLQADRMECSGLALPKPEEPPSSERVAIEQRIDSFLTFDRAIVSLYTAFLTQRTADSWAAQRDAMRTWMHERASSRVSVAAG
jgi:hypothetical protein